MTKVIKLKLLTQQDLVLVKTEATTLGEFKAEEAVQDLGIDWSSTKLIDRATKVTLDLDESVMPSVDSIMFVTPTKTKSGADLSYKEAKAKIMELVEEGEIDKISWMGKTTKDLNDIINAVELPVEELDNEKGALSLKSNVVLKVNNLSDGDKGEIIVTQATFSEVNEEGILIAELSVLLKKAGKKLKKLSKATGRNTIPLLNSLESYKKELADFVTKDDLTLEAEALAHRF